MKKTITTLGAMASMIGASQAALVAGDSIGIDFGSATTDSNFNAVTGVVTNLNAISTLTGATTDSLFSLATSGATFFGVDGAHQGPTAPTANFSAAHLNDWSATYGGAGTVQTITFSGLNDSLTYNLTLAIGHSTDQNLTGGTFGGDLTGSIALGANSAATHLVTFNDLTTGGDGTITFTYGGAVASGFSALELSAVPEPSSAALLGLGSLALILRRRK